MPCPKVCQIPDGRRVLGILIFEMVSRDTSADKARRECGSDNRVSQNEGLMELFLEDDSASYLTRPTLPLYPTGKQFDSPPTGYRQ